jgi:hypothetical protein
LNKVNFHKDKSSADGFSHKCKKCQNLANRKSYTKHLESRLEQYRHYYRTTGIFTKYGLTPKEWDKLYESQQGCCAICGRHQSEVPEKRRLAVDHNHLTGSIRGLLCTSCNTKLGWLENNFSSIVDYLKKDV